MAMRFKIDLPTVALTIKLIVWLRNLFISYFATDDIFYVFLKQLQYFFKFFLADKAYVLSILIV